MTDSADGAGGEAYVPCHDAPETEPQLEPGSGGSRVRRRSVVAGVAGTGVAGVWYAATRGTAESAAVTAPPPPDRQAAVRRAADVGDAADRDASYARLGEAAPAPATTAPPATARPAPVPVFATAGEAAAGTEVTVPTILPTDDPVLHLLRRASWGPTPALVAEVRERGIDAWLAEQLDPTSIADDEVEGVVALYPRASMTPAEIRASVDRFAWDAMIEHGRATVARQVWSRRQLREVMTDFWADHLHVATPSASVWDVAGPYQDDVIRRHALGSFTDMLLAAGRHPALLRFLTNDRSHKDSVNENMGRELLELHTVGVASGYTEEDVRNSGRILTGRTVVGRDDPGDVATFRYDPAMHWTGPVRVLEFEAPNAAAEDGLEVGDAYLRYLAAHPATARTIARKLAVRFVADAPPDALVDRLAAAFTDSGTAIAPVLEVLFRSGEFWAAVGQKTRRPLENLVATARVLDIRPGSAPTGPVDYWYWIAGQMGHAPLAWPAPDGYPDVQAAWRSANGLLEAWNVHRSLVHGWEEGVTYVPAHQLVGDRPQATVGEYVDSLCQRLCYQLFQPQRRDALIAFLDADAATPVGETALSHPDHVGHLAPLVLDSPYFALR